MANAPTTMAFGFHDIWRSPTRYIDTRKRAKSVTMSIAPMASQRVDYTGRNVSFGIKLMSKESSYQIAAS